MCKKIAAVPVTEWPPAITVVKISVALGVVNSGKHYEHSLTGKCFHRTGFTLEKPREKHQQQNIVVITFVQGFTELSSYITLSRWRNGYVIG